MKKIEAIIRPESLEDVKEALSLLGHAGLTVIDVKGHGVQKGITQQWRGQEYTIDLLPKVMVWLVVSEHAVRDAVDVIIKAAQSGRIGDGKVFISPVEDVYRVRTGERCADAI